MILSAEKLCLQYGTRAIANDMSFGIDRAEIVSIIGPNGSGKSTLLKALGRLLKPTKGIVLLEGKDIHLLPAKEIAKKLSLLPQHAQAPGDMTVRDLVLFGRLPHRKFFADIGHEDLRAMERAMEATETLKFQHCRLDTLSGGERQRAWLAMALAQEPEILLLDEPTTYLDIRHQLELMLLIERLHKELGLTVVMVLHDLNHAARFSSRLVAIKEGEIVADGTVEKVFTSTTLRDLYGVETSVLKLRQGEKEHLVCLPHGVCTKSGT